MAKKENLDFCVAIASNNVLKKRINRAQKAVEFLYSGTSEKHQHFVGPFAYKAESWDEEQMCYAKVEYIGKGMNTRLFISNFKSQNAREIYFDFYVKRGDTSENRIKEVKNMCFSDRLSCHNFIANFFRLIISTIAYKFFVIIKLDTFRLILLDTFRLI